MLEFNSCNTIKGNDIYITTLVLVRSLLLDNGKTIKFKILLIILILGGFGSATINTLLAEKEEVKRKKLEAQKK